MKDMEEFLSERDYKYTLFRASSKKDLGYIFVVDDYVIYITNNCFFKHSSDFCCSFKMFKKSIKNLLKQEVSFEVVPVEVLLTHNLLPVRDWAKEYIKTGNPQIERLEEKD